MATKLYLPNITANFFTRSRHLKVYDGSFPIIDEVIDSAEGEDIDYWVGVEINDKVWDFNLSEEFGETNCTLCAYPVEDDQIITSVWQRIPI